MKTILLVDDKSQRQDYFRATLAGLGPDWELRCVDGVSDARACMEDVEVDVVLASVELAELPGMDLLERIRAEHPTTARILVTEERHMHELLVSGGVAHQFLVLPCEDELVCDSIKRVCRIRSLLNNRVIRELVGGLDALPSLPSLYLELSSEMESSFGGSIKRIAEIVGKDLAMSAKLLQLANSAYFGVSQRVETARQAVILLGAEVIRSLVLLDAVSKSFRTDQLSGELDWLWQHSLAVGSAAQALARSEGAGIHEQGQAMQAGMLHDIGKLILATSYPDRYLLARQVAEQEQLPFIEAEHKVFDCDHGQVGAYLLGLWGLPDSIVEAVAYHHMPVSAQLEHEGFSPLMAVYAADLCVDHCPDTRKFHAGPSVSEGLASIAQFAKYDKWMEIVNGADAGLAAGSR